MNVKKLVLTNLPYVLFVYPFDKVSQAFRLAPGADLSAKILSIGDGFASAFSSLAPSFHLLDLLIGIAGAVIIRLIVHFKGKNAKTKGALYSKWLCTNISVFIFSIKSKT